MSLQRRATGKSSRQATIECFPKSLTWASSDGARLTCMLMVPGVKGYGTVMSSCSWPPRHTCVSDAFMRSAVMAAIVGAFGRTMYAAACARHHTCGARRGSFCGLGLGAGP